MGVAFGVITGLIFGSIFLLISYIKQANLHWFKFIIPRDMAGLLISAFFATSLANFGINQKFSILVVMGVALLCNIFLVFLGWFNPARMMIKGAIKIKE